MYMYIYYLIKLVYAHYIPTIFPLFLYIIDARYRTVTQAIVGRLPRWAEDETLTGQLEGHQWNAHGTRDLSIGFGLRVFDLLSRCRCVSS